MNLKPTLLFFLLPFAFGLAATNAAVNHSDATEQSEALTPKAILASQLKDIVSSTTMSRKSQVRLISSAIRTTVTAAAQGTSDPAKILKIALDIAVAAGRAAPQFADEIADSINKTPAIAQIDGALSLIKDAVRQGQDEADEPDTAYPEREKHHKGQEDHDFGGHCDDPVVSPSGPHQTKSGT